ncbi:MULTISPECIES: hypothetical protein [unclassified Methanoculleus]|uniref:hypothetical protein n=1 Tax=unclassified Methanoculleus TaxID=2619537 RepID=UPI0025D22DD6|nr:MULTISPECIES: hypothetical protein [unclassified Methanoculleus]MCK9317809.1 hypothetical protein [Methanoculleus sp.]MDD2255098.1 hypothetical protein [Methanoculleus sp.]MDD2788797.1 hypothetical protein [Methanoculleus sp.]MDD3217288.1 hypothetical protein [Methanoculleus sp.]MDD4315394.1 hypothetical protein [Methanoculleus sp.]
MMQSILERIGAGAFTLPSLAMELGISRESLLDRLALMERLGYIACERPCETVPGRCRCCSGGCGCGGAADLPVRYVLTAKGKRLCGRGR